MKIAYFSPFNPLMTGISDYSEELLPELSKKVGTIDLFVDNITLTNKNLSKLFNVYNIESFQDVWRDYDEIIYHIGNNAKYHEKIYLTALKYPGIVVLHDFAIHHLIAQITVGRDDWESYIEEMKYNYGAVGEQFSKESKSGQRTVMWETGSTLKYPANKRLIDRSKGIIVHSKFAEHEIMNNIKKDTVVQYAPLFANNIKKVEDSEVSFLRNQYGVKNEDVVFGSFGFVSRAKRIDIILDVIKELSLRHKNFTYLVVGEEEKSVIEVSKLIKKMDLQEYVKFVGYVDLDEFEDYVKLCDVCINLRYPTQGETSASLYRILGYGKPCLVTDIGSFSEIPDDVCIKIRLDNEKSDIYEALEMFLTNKDKIKLMGENAYEYVNEHFKSKDTIDSYLQIIDKVSNNGDGYSKNAWFYDQNLENISNALFEIGISNNDKYISSLSNKINEVFFR
jgi:glycosyltransferase involved in cell wall biosynthesis